MGDEVFMHNISLTLRHTLIFQNKRRIIDECISVCAPVWSPFSPSLTKFFVYFVLELESLVLSWEIFTILQRMCVVARTGRRPLYISQSQMPNWLRPQ